MIFPPNIFIDQSYDEVRIHKYYRYVIIDGTGLYM